MLKKRTLTFNLDHRYTVVLDPAEVFPEDPGQGTPAMVYGPGNASGTFFCAMGEGELVCGPVDHELPSNVMRWLESIAGEVDTFLNSATAEAQSNAA